MKSSFGIILLIFFIATLAGAETVATPTFSVNGGTYRGRVDLLVQCSTPGATIDYTLDGSDPTEGDPVPVLYSCCHNVAIGTRMICTLKARAFKPGMEPSAIKWATYTTPDDVILLIPGSGLYAEAQEVVIASIGGSTVYYTLDGTQPALGSASIPSGGKVLIDHAATLRAMYCKTDGTPMLAVPAYYSFRKPAIVHVQPKGDHENDGLSWETAKRTIQEAMDMASAGDEIWVAAGIYDGISIKHGVKVYGGFGGSEAERDQRDYVRNKTTIKGVSVRNATSATVIDGFTIERGPGAYSYGIQGQLASPTIQNNAITWNGEAGIMMYGAPDCYIIKNNLVTGNGSGIYIREYGLFGGELAARGLIINNTSVGNRGSGIVTFRMSGAFINNLVCFNGYGITSNDQSCFDSNCVYGNKRENYYGEFPHPTDINVDPLFRDMANGDYRLSMDSPCIDAGTNEGAPTTDIEGSIRPMDGNHDGLAVVDIGAYESPMPVQIDILHDAIRLQPNKLVQVAILSDPIFNALNVDPKTVVFGPGQAKEIHGQGHLADVNADGLTDLLFHFSCAESGIVPGYQTVNLVGKLVSGEDIIGSDGVTGIVK